MQLAVEYLLHVQNALGEEAARAELGRRNAIEATRKSEAKALLEAERRRAAGRQSDELREVALALAAAARSAGVDTARWLSALRDDAAAHDDEALVDASPRRRRNLRGTVPTDTAAERSSGRRRPL